tara:strand:+ start:560 stop:781 length:222 start_codon:yes stop_codon:yes gene_type:complete
MNVRNTLNTVKKKLVSKYLVQDKDPADNKEVKSTDINILLNRVKLDQKKESRKKIIFSAAATAGVALFGLIIF